MTRTLCIANQKGGVGKTTTAINLAVGLAKAGQRTLLVDLDPQCNATSGLGFTARKRHPFLSNRPIAELVESSTQSCLSVVPGSHSFDDANELANDPTKTTARLTELQREAASIDFVLVDCPPSLGTLTESALAASTEVVMPIQCEYFAMEGLTQMIEVIRRVMKRKERSSLPSTRLEFGGVLLTMYDHSLELTLEVEEEVREFFGEVVFQTVIPRDVAVAEAPSFGQSVLDYAPRSRGTRAFIELCMEVLEYEQG